MGRHPLSDVSTTLPPWHHQPARRPQRCYRRYHAIASPLQTPHPHLPALDDPPTMCLHPTHRSPPARAGADGGPLGERRLRKPANPFTTTLPNPRSQPTNHRFANNRGRRAVGRETPPEARQPVHHHPAQSAFPTNQPPVCQQPRTAGRWAIPPPIPATLRLQTRAHISPPGPIRVHNQPPVCQQPRTAGRWAIPLLMTTPLTLCSPPISPQVHC
jgi:hypothetical protein